MWLQFLLHYYSMAGGNFTSVSIVSKKYAIYALNKYCRVCLISCRCTRAVMSVVLYDGWRTVPTSGHGCCLVVFFQSSC